MKPFTYERAKSPADAAAAAARNPDAKFIAGGTNLLDLMKLEIETPKHLIDVNGLGFDKIEPTPDGGLRIGALVRNTDLAADERIRRDYGVLSRAIVAGASGQLRNKATTAGNLLQRTRCPYFYDTNQPCNKRKPGSGCAAQEGINRGHALLGGSESCIAVYPGDFAVALVAFDAKVDVIGPGGRRTIELEHLHREPDSTPHLETMLEPGELILRIRVPMTPLGRASTYHKIRDRESYAFALASAAVALRMDGDSVRDVRIAIGGLGTRPWRARAAEQALRGRALTPETARAVGDAALQGAKASRDNAFRIELGARTVADALMIASRRT